MSKEEAPPAPGAAVESLRSLTEALRARKAGPGDVSARIQKILADAQETMSALAAKDAAYLHLPEQPESTTMPEEFVREREQLRASVLTLQQERDSLRARIRELEAALQSSQQAPSEQPVVRVSATIDISFDAFDPSGHKRRMGDILLEAGIISAEQLHELLQEQAQFKQKRLGKLLVERGMTTEEMIGKVLAAQLKLPFVDLNAYHVVDAAALQLSGDVARRHECVPIDGDLSGITLAMANPLDLLAIENVELTCKRRVSPVVAVPSAISALIDRLYGA